MSSDGAKVAKARFVEASDADKAVEMARTKAINGRLSSDRTLDQRRSGRAYGVTSSVLESMVKDAALPIDVAGGKLSIGVGHVLWTRETDPPVIQLAKIVGDTVQVLPGVTQLGIAEVAVQRRVTMGLV